MGAEGGWRQQQESIWDVAQGCWGLSWHMWEGGEDIRDDQSTAEGCASGPSQVRSVCVLRTVMCLDARVRPTRGGAHGGVM